MFMSTVEINTEKAFPFSSTVSENEYSDMRAPQSIFKLTDDLKAKTISVFLFPPKAKIRNWLISSYFVGFDTLDQQKLTIIMYKKALKPVLRLMAVLPGSISKELKPAPVS